MDDEAFARLSPTQQKEWLKRERGSLDAGVLRHLLEEVRACRAGVLVDTISGTELRVPIIGVWLVDHPQHMWLTGCRQCGFCNVALRGKGGLSDFDAAVELRWTADVEALFRSHANAKALHDGLSEREAKRQAKGEVQRLAKIIAGGACRLATHRPP